VLHHDVATDVLRSGSPLRVARDVSIGDERIFRESLQQAKLALQKASGTLTTGFKPEQKDMLRLGSEIIDMAIDLNEQMERKSRPARKKPGDKAE
jgi:hypothetical protein